MADIKLNASKRESLGKNQVNKLRGEKLVPGILYKRGGENIPVQIEAGEFDKVYREAGSSSLIDVLVDGHKEVALIKEIQRHPFKNIVLHVDFQTIRMDEVIRLSVPIHLEGRDEIRLQPSVLNQILSELEIECLPGAIPEEVSINVSDMDFETPIYVKDLEVFSDDSITVFHEEDDIVATLSEPQEVVEEEEDGEVDAADVPTVDETEEENEEGEE